MIPFQTCIFFIMIVLILASIIFHQLVIGIIYVIYNKMSIFWPFRMQIVSKSSQNHSNLYDSEWRIPFLSDMRCVIRPQNYSICKPINFAIFLKKYFQRTRLKNISEWNTLNTKFEERRRFKYVANKCSLNMFATSLFKISHYHIIWLILLPSRWIQQRNPRVFGLVVLARLNGEELSNRGKLRF